MKEKWKRRERNDRRREGGREAAGTVKRERARERGEEVVKEWLTLLRGS